MRIKLFENSRDWAEKYILLDTSKKHPHNNVDKGDLKNYNSFGSGISYLLKDIDVVYSI
jgi:hypothetical protein